MPKKASTHGASAPSKSKTARSKTAKAKSKDKAAPRNEARKAASEAASKRTAAAATQKGSLRRSRSCSSSPNGKPNPRFTYRDHSPAAGSPVFDIPMITGSESDGDSPGSTKDPTPSQDAAGDDTESPEAKAASTSSPAKNLSLDEGKTGAQAAKADSQERVDEGAAAAKKRAAPETPSRESGFSKGYHSLFDSSDEGEEEGAATEPQEISNDLDEQ
ncbi:ABC Superfamily [Phytophthora palmivora]|uniref:ABC Superfamily n=1 Tax=Phytophthora palmivora TaxID=4796 RepID=A0A2P4XBK0_9STRA|nr:ABC Superfamily [Phytophthora palmivora]